ncbi:hypothetical protein [Fluviispira multicolorata]|uniref:Uncharacterized protein n=1 Tax=Fluviispira multicolorata TaxID=2654512 RepID=A0A833JH76_9BACT|nr:hypothetical protein [Fluviispira multicolorata]KAB8033242.1 hypothetical protein GCL57_00675 [Fluviispira multicolorata]
MKQSEKLWIQNLARVSLGKTLKASHAAQMIQQSVSVFFEELCSLMINYSNYFNELIAETKPQDCNRIFQTSQPRPGLIVLKGGDKMIISLEGKMIRVRTVQVHINCERNFQSYDFEPKQNEVGAVVWNCINDGQIVNPQLVAEHYLTSFLVSGCRAISQTLRLVAVASHP